MALSVVLVTGGFDHKIRFWEATTGICSRTLRFGESQVNKLSISEDKHHVVAGGHPHLQLYDVNSSNDNPLQTFEGHTHNVTDLGFQRDSNWLYSCSEDGTMKIWDMRASGCQISIECRSAVNTVALHPNETEIVTGDQAGCVKVWDMHMNTCRFEDVPQADVPVRSVSMVSIVLYTCVCVYVCVYVRVRMCVCMCMCVRMCMCVYVVSCYSVATANCTFIVFGYVSAVEGCEYVGSGIA
jgi:G protein beta subunit-like protein